MLVGAAGLGAAIAGAGTAAVRVLGPERQTAAGSGPLTVYGAPGTFGQLADHAPAVTIDVPGFGFGPGQAAYMTTVAADGTVFMSTTPFTDDQTRPTGSTMELAVFDQAGLRFSRLVIPSTAGRTAISSPDPAKRGIGGADVSDVLVVPDPEGGERLVFVSAVPFHGWNVLTEGEYPTFGQLRPGPSRTWRYDRSLSLTAGELATRTGSPTAAQAFPMAGALAPRSARGPASVARLPRSGHLVVAQYFGDPLTGTQSGALAVLDLTGRLRAWWQYPPTSPVGIRVVVNPREVVADPSSEPDDERFVLISDCRDEGGTFQPFPIQEFSYSATAGRIVPKSTAVRAVQDWSRMESACFDSAGNLYVARTKADGLRADPMAVYPKLGRERSLVLRAPATGDWTQSFGIECRPEYLVAGTGRGGLVRSLTTDPATDTILLVGLDGLLQAVRPEGAGKQMTFSIKATVDTGLTKLRGPTTRYVGVRRGGVDAKRRILWLPVNQMVLDGLTWPYPPFKLDQWLMRVDLRVLLGS
ncbi:hypothetical protein BCD49_16195 [Pseudofrankia sp. EUN1h]|nr:hypothetical protein BCD49_16195 [Pseudofrankia sp. EUN1h]